MVFKLLSITVCGSVMLIISEGGKHQTCLQWVDKEVQVQLERTFESQILLVFLLLLSRFLIFEQTTPQRTWC